MDEYDVTFPKGAKIYIDHTEDGVRVRVFERNKKRGPKVKVDRKEHMAMMREAARLRMAEQRLLSDADLDAALIRMVTEKPGHGRSYYEQTPFKLGGVNGSQARKEEAVRRLLETNQIRIVPLAKPKGRKTHGVYPA